MIDLVGKMFLEVLRGPQKNGDDPQIVFFNFLGVEMLKPQQTIYI